MLKKTKKLLQARISGVHQVRYLALLIIDELFMRSKLFRTILIENLDLLLSLSVGFRRNLPLPAPPSIASILRSKAIEFLEKWNDSFGIHHRQLRLGFDYLKNTLRYQFPNIQANASRREQERRERERRSKEILLNKYETLKANFSTIKEEIHSTVDEIGECLDILHSKEEHMPLDALDDEEFEEFRSSELRQIRLDSLKEGERVHENSENKVVFDALRELYKLLVSKHFASVQEWISVLVRVDVADSRFRDSALKEFIDIRNQLQPLKKKCEEAGCALLSTSNDDGEEQDFWEDGKVGPIESIRPIASNKRTEPLDAASNSHRVNYVALGSSNKESNDIDTLGHKCKEVDPNSMKSKLLAEAPVVEWGSSLDAWGSNRIVLANQRGLELESHWGRVDYDAVIPADKIAELNVQATLYREQQIEIQQCHAPLRKGGLCERRDLRVCPFHGPIVPRDEEGKPLNQSPSRDKIHIDLGTDLVEELAKQAVKNVRERDKEAAMKREVDKQTLKRAKLAKIREHNEAVLRNAALASTSRSAAISGDVEATNEENLLARNKKQSLSSMLRKKVTSKDRIAQKLLNTRARDATITQQTLSDDAVYREAFPNQW
ncbi:UV-stimulated scaffold protein A-like [Quillaja saponaria]|uniref:UV-stimulated scaffold protein A-like n=1 Tax=Quillaja saponaria TaxID=32244 RepID=A0AAD7L4W2_QUISA|nr:UV-stimulated scaffold protein A-like [Quillaja saponaria]